MFKSSFNSSAGPSLTDLLVQRIRHTGPITFYEWMREALYHRSYGFYTRPEMQIWGRGGDYRTSPETSELFAGTFARYFARLFNELLRPQDFQILECGAGDGTFAYGVLKSLESGFPEVYSATSYVIDEISDHRTAKIQERLKPFDSKVTFASLATAETLDPGIVFSNELLDAFPVHRITKRNGVLSELYVTLNAAGDFDWTCGPVSSETLRQMYLDNQIEITDGQVIELSPDIDKFFSLVAKKLIDGYVITVDYGDEAKDLYDNQDRFQGTLRAYSRHEFAEVLKDPGEHDITTHVNWTRIRSLGSALGLRTVAFERQDKFLSNAGILDQLQLRLAHSRDNGESAQLSTAAREMILPHGMASSFQVLVQQKTSQRALN